MNKQTDSWLRKFSQLLARVWVWFPLAIGVLAIVVLIALPYGIRNGAQRWLVSQGASQVLIEDVDFNPFIGRLTARNVQVKVGVERTLSASQLDIRYELLPLLHKQIIINELYLHDAAFTIEKREDGGWRFIGLVAAPAASAKAPDKKSGWGFLLQHAEVNNSEVRYASPALTGTAHIDHGQLTVQSSPGADGPVLDSAQVRLDGRIRVESVKPGMVAEARMKAEVKATPPTEKSGTWRFTGAGQLHEINVGWPDGKLRVASAKQLDVNGLEVDGFNHITIQVLAIEQLTAAQSTAREEAPAALGAAQLRVDEIRFVPSKTLDITKISARGLSIVARHESRNRWYGFDQMNDLKNILKTPSEPAAPLTLRIGSIVLDDPGLVELSDLTIKPAFHTRLTLARAQMTGLDTGDSPAQPGQFVLSARIGKYATTELDGKFHAFTPKLSADLTAKLREFELPALSPYTIKMLGYRALSGQLNGDLNLRIANGRLEGRSKLSLENLDMKPRNVSSAEQLKSRLTMPLESALAMLRDKNNNVRLELNFAGDVNDPKFDLTDAINQALTRSMRSASVSYLKYYFQPYGTLITVAELAGKVLQLRLDPVPFVSGEADPAPATQDYLAKIGKLLGDRQNLRLKLCGKAVPRDMLSDEAAKALASRRAEVLKDFFASQYGIATDRLFLCEPELDRNAEAQARVELVL